jgi:hypothetical protein
MKSKLKLYTFLIVFIISSVLISCDDSSSGDGTVPVDYQLTLISADTHGAKYTFSFSINNIG